MFCTVCFNVARDGLVEFIGLFRDLAHGVRGRTQTAVNRAILARLSNHRYGAPAASPQRALGATVIELLSDRRPFGSYRVRLELNRDAWAVSKREPQVGEKHVSWVC